MFQSKYNYKLIIDLSKSIFESRSCETVVWPNLLKYFNDLIAVRTNPDQPEVNIYEQSVLSLLVEYLLEHKKVIEIETDHLNVQTENDSNFDQLIKRKNLSQLRRLLDDKSLNVLHSSLVSYFETICSSHDSQVDQIKMVFCVVAPLFIQDSVKIQNLVFGLSLKTLKKLTTEFAPIKSYFLQDDRENQCVIQEYEMECLLFSLSVWSMMHCENKTKGFSKPHSSLGNLSLFECLIELVHKLEELKNEIILKSNQYRFELDKYFIHLLRALKYSLNISVNHSDQSFEQLHKQVENVFNFLKNELSSPYHEVINFINIL